MDTLTAFVHNFITQLVKADRGMRSMSIFYLWEDKRPEPILDRVRLDAKLWADYERMFKP